MLVYKKLYKSGELTGANQLWQTGYGEPAYGEPV